MVEKEHYDLLKDIRRYCEQFSLGKIPLSDFFEETTYKTDRGKEYPCYNITRKGCEFIANKLTGVKGTQFTARYINRFHAMEDYIKQNDGEFLISFKEQVESLEAVAKMLQMNEASKLLMLENFYKQYNIPTVFLPKYEFNGNRQMKALSTLLSENGCGISAVKFNLILIENGYLEEKERASSKGTKKFKKLTENGLKYGENAVNPHNQKEVQPLYYEDTFMELYEKVIS